MSKKKKRIASLKEGNARKGRRVEENALGHKRGRTAGPGLGNQPGRAGGGGRPKREMGKGMI